MDTLLDAGNYYQNTGRNRKAKRVGSFKHTIILWNI